MNRFIIKRLSPSRQLFLQHQIAQKAIPGQPSTHIPECRTQLLQGSELTNWVVWNQKKTMGPIGGRRAALYVTALLLFRRQNKVLLRTMLWKMPNAIKMYGIISIMQ